MSLTEKPMTQLGEWLKRVPPMKVAVGFLFLLMTASFSLGAASVNIKGIPMLVRANSAALIILDSAFVEMSNRFITHIEKSDSEDDRRNCVLDALWEYVSDSDRTPINPNRCRGGDQ